MQTVDFVHEMQRTYAKFDLYKKNMKEMLDLAKNFPADPFVEGGPSMRTLLFATAELTKDEGHPDWVQFVALVFGLACVLKLKSNSAASPKLDFDWTVADIESRIVGCKASTCSVRADLRVLNPDEHDPRYNSFMGMYVRRCGLQNVLMSWSSNEYMYYMLKHNKVRLPDEAFTLLRLGPLVDWHSRERHQELSNDDDELMKQSVSDFYDICQRAKRSVIESGKEMGDSDCHALWESHYSFVVRKYLGASEILSW
jgi:inositol oxygenase